MRAEGPLRYPGAKSNLAPIIAAFMERHCLVGSKFVEPFAGSAAVTRYLLRADIIESSELWESNYSLYSFWKSALYDNDELQRKIALSDVSIEEFDRCRQVIADQDCRFSELEHGYAFLFLNRTSYSGIVGAGPIGGRNQNSDYGIGCRFNKEALVYQLNGLKRYVGRININHGDGITALREYSPGEFLYVDPPYFQNGKKFYPKYFSTFDHYRLRNSLKLSQSSWLLSYDYDKKVDYLYREWPRDKVELYHSARESGVKSELLVSPLGFSRVGQVASATLLGALGR
ncbi:MAG: hypothetical protein JWM33_1495 [Caulobacteraceae bacterium]|nr:hypothetical protein [Caulobacteraceae bacterium]